MSKKAANKLMDNPLSKENLFPMVVESQPQSGDVLALEQPDKSMVLAKLVKPVGVGVGQVAYMENGQKKTGYVSIRGAWNLGPQPTIEELMHYVPEKV